MNDIYTFKEEDAEEFRRSVNGRAKKQNGQMVFARCPYCNGGAHKDKDTFAISLSTGQFECKRSSCGAKGNMITLAKDFSNVFNLGRDVSVYHNIDGINRNFKKFRDAHKKIEVREGAVEYLKSRGIPEEITKKYEVTTQPENSKVIVFPFKDETGELKFVKYRNIDPNREGAKEWCIAGNYPKILFGMNHCEDFSSLVITEGQIDSLSLSAAGIKNAVSVPTGKNGFTWKPIVWNWLVKFDEIVVFGDRENGEITLAKEITQFFPKKVRIVKIEDYHGCKDANEILQKCGANALKAAVENAETQISLRIKNLSEVDDIDLESMTAYKTGIATLDESIGKGFHDGELIILTGACGEGKSTFASQIVCQMIQNGLKCFCYSGELPNYMFKAWLDKQITCGISAYREKASKWYDGKCFIYDNSAVIDEKEEVFKVMTEAVRYLGCKFILIDNLMTAMEDKPSDDLFRQQSKFVTDLTKFAKGFNVVILLVAHPKKNGDNSNDSIAGSGDITNRANVVLRFQRDRDAKGNIVNDNLSKILITKNRTTGKLNDKGILVNYEPDSMRIHESNAEVKPFIEEENDGFVPAEEFNEEIPF